MRIIDTIPHPLLKITVFKIDHRISVKFENADFEQTFKLGSDERYQNPEVLRQWIDDTLLAEVLRLMKELRRIRQAADQRAFPRESAAEDAFEQIV